MQNDLFEEGKTVPEGIVWVLRSSSNRLHFVSGFEILTSFRIAQLVIDRELRSLPKVRGTEPMERASIVIPNKFLENQAGKEFDVLFEWAFVDAVFGARAGV
mgnify:CR=1 FL=1